MPNLLNRRQMLTASGLVGLGGLSALAACTRRGTPEEATMSPAPTAPGSQPPGAPTATVPVGFVGHGAPTLALDATKGADLARWAADWPAVKAILVVSAHWEAAPASLGATQPVPLIYDFSGFPRPLYQLTYPAPGAPALAERVAALLGGAVRRAPERGLDHGAWVPLIWLRPAADLPVLQLSLPGADARVLFDLGRRLAPLRREGVLVLGSGNVVHNLRRVDFRPDAPTPAWAEDFDAWVAERLSTGDVDGLLQYGGRPDARIAHPTVEHFSPLLVAAGAAWGEGGGDAVRFPVTGFEFGSIARRVVQFG